MRRSRRGASPVRLPLPQTCPCRTGRRGRDRGAAGNGADRPAKRRPACQGSNRDDLPHCAATIDSPPACVPCPAPDLPLPAWRCAARARADVTVLPARRVRPLLRTIPGSGPAYLHACRGQGRHRDRPCAPCAPARGTAATGWDAAAHGGGGGNEGEGEGDAAAGRGCGAGVDGAGQNQRRSDQPSRPRGPRIPLPPPCPPPPVRPLDAGFVCAPSLSARRRGPGTQPTGRRSGP